MGRDAFEQFGESPVGFARCIAGEADVPVGEQAQVQGGGGDLAFRAAQRGDADAEVFEPPDRIDRECQRFEFPRRGEGGQAAEAFVGQRACVRVDRLGDGAAEKKKPAGLFFRGERGGGGRFFEWDLPAAIGHRWLGAGETGFAVRFVSRFRNI